MALLETRGDAERQLQSRELEKAITGLPNRERLPTQLRFLGLSYPEIAMVLGIAESKVANCLSAARAMLRRHLEGGWCDPRPADDLPTHGR